MKIIRLTVNDLFLEELNNYKLTPYVQENIETGLYLYRDMKKFYDKLEKIMPYTHYIYFLLDDKLVVGYRYIYLNKDLQSGELFSIAIDPAYRKKGYAKMLIQVAVEFMRKNNIQRIKVPLIKKEADFCILKEYYELVEKQNADIHFEITSE